MKAPTVHQQREINFRTEVEQCITSLMLSKDEEFARYVTSSNDETSVTGNLMFDRFELVRMIKARSLSYGDKMLEVQMARYGDIYTAMKRILKAMGLWD